MFSYHFFSSTAHWVNSSSPERLKHGLKARELSHMAVGEYRDPRTDAVEQYHSGRPDLLTRNTHI